MNKALVDHLNKGLYTYVEDGMGYQLYDQPHTKMSQFFESCLPPPPAEMQTTEQGYNMYLAPRETLKTSFAQGLAEHFITKWKTAYGYDGRVLFVRASREASQSVLSAIREDFSEANSVLTRAYGDLKTDSILWAKEGITLNWRTTSYREPSIDTASTGLSKTGYHYDLIIVDDLANENNYFSVVEMANARRMIQALLPVLNNWGSLLVIGTRWGHNDPYAWILDQNARAATRGEKEPWRVCIESCYNQDGTLFYPAYLSEARLAQKRSVMEEKMYASNYLNVVLADESMVFRKSEQRFYDGYFTPRSQDIATLTVQEGPLAGNVIPVNCNIHVDPATSVASQANYTGINVVLTDQPMNRWVHESLKLKEMPSDMVSRLLAMCRHYLPDSISIDVLGQQILWIDLLRGAMDEAGLNDIPITQYRGKDNKIGMGLIGKSRRIEAMQPMFREGRIFLRSGAVGPLVRELDTYDGVTPTNHFDVLDSLSHTMTLAKPASERSFQIEQERQEWEDEFGDDPIPEPRKVPGTWAGR